MRRFLFVMWEGGGTVPPELGIATRLIARGHQVHVLGDPTIESGALRIGAGFTPWRSAPHVNSLRPEDALIKDWEITNPLALFRAARDAILCGPTREFAAETLAAIDDFTPDAVAADMVLLGAQIAAEKATLPCAVLVPNLYPVPTPGRPMLGSGLLPGKGPFGRMRDAVMRGVFTRLFDSGLPPVNAARTALGLSPLAHTFDQHEHAACVLVLSSEVFDFPGPPFPANVKFVGAQLDDPLWAEPWTSPFDARDERPLVLVGLSSTFQNQLPVLERIADALAGLPVRGLITAGPALAGQMLRVAENVRVVGSAPHTQIIPQARIVVSHCGHGTTLKTLSAGVPLLCMPMGRDQGDNAARVVWHGAGLRLKPSATTDQIRKALSQLLADDRYAHGAGVLADKLRRERKGDAAVEALEALALHPSLVAAP